MAPGPQMFAQDDILDSLLCGACGKYLSCFPVYLSQANLSLCGRCSPYFAEDSYIHDTLYEAIAQKLKFPCTYEQTGCPEKLCPPKMMAHEKICSYRQLSCKADGCMWEGVSTALRQHSEDSHPAFVLANGEFEIDLLNSYETDNLIVFDEEIFTFKRDYKQDKQELKCTIMCYGTIDHTQKYSCKILIENGARNRQKEYPIKVIDSMENCTTEIDIDELKKLLDDPSLIIGRVIISNAEEECADDELVSAVKKSESEVNFQMLEQLECPICFHYIIPPIFQCVQGHSICSSCKNDVKECPTCKAEIQNTRNFTLEHMASNFFIYPCQFQEYGCNFSAKPGLITEHERLCLFGPQECPLKDYETCPWKNRAKEVLPHVQAQHYDNILDIDTVSVFITDNYYQEEERNCYILQFSNRLFKLHYLYKENTFYWAMQLVGPSEDCNKFQFEIDIVDATNEEKRMFARRFCAPYKNKDESFDVPGQFVFFQVDQINTFFTNLLTYRVRILKMQ